MLNYIWAGLIIFSLVFALAKDFTDVRRDTYRNGQRLPVTLRLKEPYAETTHEIPVDVVIKPAEYSRFYGTPATPAPSYAGTLIQTDKGRQLRFAKDVPLPEPLRTMREAAQSDEADIGELRGTVGGLNVTGDTAATTVTLDRVQFHKLGNITKAAVARAKGAASFALGLIGVLALWLGMLRIAEKSGLVDLFVRLVQPILRPLFPGIPAGHPALGLIAINLSANMLGLGNAATAPGLKAMEELQKLNPSPDTATNPMVMLLALNTTCLQLVPSATLIAVLGLQAAEVILPTILCGACAIIVAIVAVKLLGRLPTYRNSDPDITASSSPTGN